MEITLTRTGGIIPIVKQAKKVTDLNESEIKQLTEKIKANHSPGQARDATYFQLSYNGVNIPVDLEKVPPEYRQLFDELKSNLKIEKP